MKLKRHLLFHKWHGLVILLVTHIYEMASETHRTLISMIGNIDRATEVLLSNISSSYLSFNKKQVLAICSSNILLIDSVTIYLTRLYLPELDLSLAPEL